MLAWVHQALASERELLLSLFGEPDADAMGDTGGASGDMPSIARLLDRVFESICKPLKARPTTRRPCCLLRNNDGPFVQLLLTLTLHVLLCMMEHPAAASETTGTSPCEAREQES